MSKLFPGVLAWVLAAAAFLAAASLPAAPRKVLTHYHWSSDNYDPISLAAAKGFMAQNPDVEVKMFLLPEPSRSSVIRTVIASGRPIDTFAVSSGESAQFLGAGQMVPIIPAAFGKTSVQDVAAMWIPGAIQACGGAWEGRYYGIPFELSNYVGWINTEDMREAGLDPARDIPRTWDQFVLVASKLVKVEGGTRVRNGFAGNSKEGVFNFLIVLAMMEQLGLDWGTEKGLVASMDQPAVLARGLRTYTDFVTSSRIWDPTISDNDRSAFGTNKTGIFLTGGSWYWGFLKTYPVKRSDVTPFPYPRFPDGRDIGGVGYGYSLFVTPQAKDPSLAFRFLDAMASRPNEFLRLGLYQPRVTLSSGAPAVDPALARRYITFYEEVFKGELSHTAVWLSSTRGLEIRDAVWRAICRVIYEGRSVDDAVAALQSEIRGLFPRR